MTREQILRKYCKDNDRVSFEGALEAIRWYKEEALTFLAQEREKIMRMTHKEALKELIKVHKIESRIKIINAISDNGLFTLK